MWPDGVGMLTGQEPTGVCEKNARRSKDRWALPPAPPNLNVEDVLLGVHPDEKNKRPITRKVLDRCPFNIDFGGLGGKLCKFWFAMSGRFFRKHRNRISHCLSMRVRECVQQVFMHVIIKVQMAFRISRKERGYYSHPLSSLQLLQPTTLLTRKWRAQGQGEKSSLLGLKLVELWPSLGEMASRRRAHGNPLCECGRPLATLSPQLQETWANYKGRKWGTRPGWSGA